MDDYRIRFNFAPQIIFIFATGGLYGPKGGVIASIVLSAGYTQNRYLINQGWALNEESYVKVENNTIFWYYSNNDAGNQFNSRGTYLYVAIG